MTIGLAIATWAVTRPLQDQMLWPLLPALRSVWLQVHVLSAAFGYGAFGVAAAFAIMFIRHNQADSVQAQSGDIPLEDIQRQMERTTGLGFPWLSLAILTGAIWAQDAWGRYWGWDPKEIWSLVTWLWYLLVFHLGRLRKWRGKRLAGLVIVGFGLILFTFLGVPWLVRTVRLESLHGF
jgi:cytochrome c-type biogenesis protein CcsB